ncbi:MAG TPA: PQQ-binding-like beta-propeller repeat protein [Humisphaera sp.]
MHRRRLLVLAAALAAPAVAGLSVAAFAGSSWPQFRGPTMQGVSDEKGLPEVLDAKQGVAWKTDIKGKAWSSPVIADGKVWLSTATPDGKELSVVRLDAKTGKVEHDEVLFRVANPQFCIPFNSYASPTPVIEGDRVYVTFGSPGTACLDAKTGAKIWERTDLQCNHFRGPGSSPTLWQDRLFMNYDGSDFQYIVALDKATGKTLWKTDRSADYRDADPKTGKPKADGDFRKSFTTPRVATYNGRTEVVSVGSKCAYAYDPATGKELWRLEFAAAGNPDSHTVGVTPVLGPDLMYLCTGNGKSEMWAVKPGGTGQLNGDAIVWRVKKNVPKRASPLLVDGLLYTVDDDGMAICTDAKTGEEAWKQRLSGKGFSASPTFADGRIYFVGENGATTTILPGREFKKVGEGEFPDGFMASPAVADGAFFLRTKTALYRVGK